MVRSPSSPSFTETSLGKGLEVLGALAQIEEGAGLVELARLTGYPKSTVHRLLATLARHGYVDQLPDGRYAIGLRLFEVGNRAGVRVSLRDLAVDELGGLVDAVGETAHLGVLAGTEVVYVDKVESRQSIRMSSRIGHRNPLYCTGIGKALLAFAGPELVAAVVRDGLPARTPHTITSAARLRTELARTRERGWSVDDEEVELGLRCVGAPIVGRDGALEGALSIAGPTQRLGADVGERFGPLVAAAADRVGVALGRRVAAGAVAS